MTSDLERVHRHWHAIVSQTAKVDQEGSPGNTLNESKAIKVGVRLQPVAFSCCLPAGPRPRATAGFRRRGSESRPGAS